MTEIDKDTFMRHADAVLSSHSKPGQAMTEQRVTLETVARNVETITFGDPDGSYAAVCLAAQDVVDAARAINEDLPPFYMSNFDALESALAALDKAERGE